MIPRFLLAAATLLLLTACAKDAAKPETSAEAEAETAAVELHFHAINGLNPGANGQAAPVRVRIFELKNAATFARSDYFALADRAQSTLGLDLLDQDEVMVQPGEQLSIHVPARQYTEYQISLDVRAVRADVVVTPSSPAQ